MQVTITDHLSCDGHAGFVFHKIIDSTAIQMQITLWKQIYLVFLSMLCSYSSMTYAVKYAHKILHD